MPRFGFRDTGAIRQIGPYALLALPPLLWAGNFIVGRALRADVPPMTLAFARHVVALICVLPFAFLAMTRNARQFWHLRWLVVRTALAGLAGFNLCIYVGLHATAASNALLLNSTIPLLIVGLGSLFYRQKPTAAQGWGMLMSSVGVLIVISHGDVKQLTALQFSTGDLTVFLGMALFALYSLWLRKLPAGLSRVGLLGWQLVVASVALLPGFVWDYATGQRAHWALSSLAGVGYVALFTSVFATLLYTSGVAKIGPARAGLYIHLIPVFGVILSTLFLNESVHLYQAVGIGVILLGLICANLRVRQHKQKRENERPDNSPARRQGSSKLRRRAG